MNGNQLLEAMSGIDEKYIADAAEPAAVRPRLHLRLRHLILPAAAACLALVWVGSGLFRPPLHAAKFVEAPDTALYCMSDEAAPEETALSNAFAQPRSRLQEAVVEITGIEGDVVTAKFVGTDASAADTAALLLDMPDSIDCAAGQVYRIYFDEFAPSGEVTAVMQAEPEEVPLE